MLLPGFCGAGGCAGRSTPAGIADRPHANGNARAFCHAITSRHSRADAHQLGSAHAHQNAADRQDGYADRYEHADSCTSFRYTDRGRSNGHCIGHCINHPCASHCHGDECDGYCIGHHRARHGHRDGDKRAADRDTYTLGHADRDECAADCHCDSHASADHHADHGTAAALRDIVKHSRGCL